MRHLDTFQCETRLHARIPRVHGSEHGKLQARIPWARSERRLRRALERGKRVRRDEYVRGLSRRDSQPHAGRR